MYKYCSSLILPIKSLSIYQIIAYGVGETMYIVKLIG